MANENQNILDAINTFKKYFDEDYAFLPIAIESEIAYFENQFNVKLPEDYKWFVLNVANGIVSKNQWGFNVIDKVAFQNHFYQETNYNPSLPFELTTKVKFSEPDEDENDAYPYEIVYDEDDDLLLKGYLNGIVQLVGYGCGTSAFLVINGQEYGNVWIDDYSSNSEVFPEYDLKSDKKRFHFNDWICNEIHRKIQQHNESIAYHKKNAVAMHHDTETASFDNSHKHQKSPSIISFIKNLFK